VNQQGSSEEKKKDETVGGVKLISPEKLSDYDNIMNPEIELKQTKLFIEDMELPEETKKRFWGMVDKQAIIGNLSEEEIMAVDNKEDLAIAWHFMGIPRWKISFDDIFSIEQLKLKSFKATRRSKGGFERMALVTQKVRQEANIVNLSDAVKKKKRWKFF